MTCSRGSWGTFQSRGKELVMVIVAWGVNDDDDDGDDDDDDYDGVSNI